LNPLEGQKRAYPRHQAAISAVLVLYMCLDDRQQRRDALRGENTSSRWAEAPTPKLGLPNNTAPVS